MEEDHLQRYSQWLYRVRCHQFICIWLGRLFGKK